MKDAEEGKTGEIMDRGGGRIDVQRSSRKQMPMAKHDTDVRRGAASSR